MVRGLPPPPNGLVDRYLTEGEVILYEAGPDRTAWAWTQCFELTTIVVVLGLVLVSGDGMVALLGLLGAGLLSAVVGWRYIDLHYTVYVLTDARALRISGVFQRDHAWISWKKVTDVSVHRTITDRWLDTATVRIHSANELSGLKEMRNVARPEEFAEAIVELVASAFGGKGGGGSGHDAALAT